MTHKKKKKKNEKERKITRTKILGKKIETNMIF